MRILYALRARLLYSDVLLTSSKKYPRLQVSHWMPSSSTTRSFSTQHAVESKRQQLFTGKRSFAVLDREVRAKAVAITNQYQFIDIRHRLPILDEEEWRKYLITFATVNLGHHMKYGSDITEDLRKLICTIAPYCENFAPIEFCNYLRMLVAFDVKQRSLQIYPKEVLENISKWFMERFDSLECSMFFEILKLKTKFYRRNSLLFTAETAEDISKYLAHGVQLLVHRDCDVCDCLYMLFILEAYKKKDDIDASSFIAQTLDCLTAKHLPNNMDDYFNSLAFVSDEAPIKRRVVNTYERAFKHNTGGNYAAWKWLRNAIELAFEENGLEHLRQLAAAAAVRAYVYKAVDFTPEEVNRFLNIAAEPLLTNPAIVFDEVKSELHQTNRSMSLNFILTAVNNAVYDTELRSLLTIYFDDAYWDRFYDMLEVEAAKLGPNRAHLFNDVVQCALFVPHIEKLPIHLRMFLTLPINERRLDAIDAIRKKFGFY